MKRNILVIALALVLNSCGPMQQPSLTNILQNETQRDSLFATILSDHDLMRGFLIQARTNDRARMMMNHLVFGNDSSSMDHEHTMQQGSPSNSATPKPSPYVGQEQRAIKSLSPQEIEQYRNGEGMGLAKAAELNHFPGPKHVLDLASELKLSQEQITSTRQVYDAMHVKAVAIGERIIQRETKLDALFASNEINQSGLAKSVKELGKMQGELRLAHLEAHLRMKGLLTSEQESAYDQLRGYQSGTHEHHQ